MLAIAPQLVHLGQAMDARFEAIVARLAKYVAEVSRANVDDESLPF